MMIIISIIIIIIMLKYSDIILKPAFDINGKLMQSTTGIKLYKSYFFTNLINEYVKINKESIIPILLNNNDIIGLELFISNYKIESLDEFKIDNIHLNVDISDIGYFKNYIIMKFLIDNYKLITMCNEFGGKLIHIICRYAEPKIIKYMIDKILI